MRYDRRWIALIAGLALAGALSLGHPTLAADASKDDRTTVEARAAITALIQLSNEAASKRNVAGTTAAMTDDFVTVDAQGKERPLAQTQGALSTLYGAAKAVKVTTTLDTVRVTGDEATVGVKEHIVMTFDNAKTGGTSTLITDASEQGAWVKTEYGWREKRSKTLSSKATLDGKPVGG